jgi:glycine dehydrogenase subunit 1
VLAVTITSFQQLWMHFHRAENLRPHTHHTKLKSAKVRLQVIFEFQSMIANLFEMDVSNASMYDGASACSRSDFDGACRCKKGKTVLIFPKAFTRNICKVIRSYVSPKSKLS